MDSVTYRRLNIEDFPALKSFYDSGRQSLERKEFFYPFKDYDLENLLSGGGIAMGAFFKDQIIGASCIDCDPDYGKILFERINAFFPHLPEGTKVCEYSGVMTRADFSRKGIASALYGILSDYAKNNLSGCVLCAVVQLENIKSLNFFYRKGFRLVSVAKYDGVDFGYLIKRADCAKDKPYAINDSVMVGFLDYDGYQKYLSAGYVGVGCADDQMILAPLT